MRFLLPPLFACSLLTAPSWAEEPLDKDDPLFKALMELRREVDELRGGMRSTMKSMPRAMPQRMTPEPRTVKTNVPSELLPPVRITRAKSDHWSFQPISNPAVPMVQDRAWARDDLDRFILSRLEAAKLRPNPDANRYTLLRRLSFDLTGLPPSVAEIQEFVNDPAPLDKALARVADRYLDSPRFGERWGRHWLDVVRYADSVGRNWNAPFTYAWRYRNYVIDAFNKDKPYDVFLTEQLAGDLLPAKDLATRREQNIATGFLALGPTDIVVPEGERLAMDRIDEQIDVTTRAFLGLTVACARCHDHKYEPITMRDYYAMAGVFYSTRTLSGQYRGNYVADDDLQLLPSSEGRRSAVPGVHSMADVSREMREGGYREVLWTTDPNLAMGAQEGRTEDCPIRIDGEFYKVGDSPPRGDFHFGGLSGLNQVAADASGRRQLARWMTSPDNPLTARVMVNRVWQHLLGRGLVPSVDNFGSSGDSPTHPELLDHLAVRFRKDWSVKSLVRAIVLSRTYRQSSRGQAAQQTDSQNELYWRMKLRRLEVEAVRDAMLTVAGRISFRRPEGIQVAGTGGKGRWGVTRSLLPLDSPYRTVYLPVLRSLLPEMYSVFDFPNPTQVKGQREVTTVAPQSLFLMNSEFAVRCARDVAQLVFAQPKLTAADRVRLIYLQLLGRQPDTEETAASLKLIDSLDARASEEYRWSALIQALMISGEFRSLL